LAEAGVSLKEKNAAWPVAANPFVRLSKNLIASIRVLAHAFVFRILDFFGAQCLQKPETCGFFLRLFRWTGTA
jgi:hypothetical protein